jgi:hypothetical protein
MIKGVLLFLVLMALIGVLGKLRRPAVGRRAAEHPIEPARKCPRCGTYLIGDSDCPCSADRPKS